MKKSEKVQLAVSSLLVILGIVYMILKGNIDLMFFFWLPHIWWVEVVTKFLAHKFLGNKEFTWRSSTLVLGLTIYLVSLWIVIPWILRMFGVNTNF